MEPSLTAPPSHRQTAVPFNYKYLMISFLILKYLWEQYINFRQLKRYLVKQIPDELKKYNVRMNDFIFSQSYSFDKITFQMLALSIRAAVNVLTIMCNLLPFIWDNVDVVCPLISMESEFQRAVIYTLVQAFKSKAFQVPISAYETFVIEKKYNMTNKTVQLFIYDLFVKAILTVIIFPLIIYGYLKVLNVNSQYFYVKPMVFVIVLTIALSWIHPNVIAPLFNKFTELKDQQLKQKIYLIANLNSIKISNIYVMNSSVRSAHSNAYLYGLGNKKTIVLYDSLLKVLNKQQILSVLCHQMGHSYYSHSGKKMFVYILQVMCMFYLFAQFVKNQSVFMSFGFTSGSLFICTALYFHMFQPLTSIFNTLLLVTTRRFQFQADTFACEQGYGDHLKRSLLKLQSANSVKPDYMYAWIKHSHPYIYQRIQNIDRASQKYRKKNDSASEGDSSGTSQIKKQKVNKSMNIYNERSSDEQEEVSEYSDSYSSEFSDISYQR